ncbi:MAG: methyl-accepting chemotaxis protein [Dehalobacterium sp.]
MTLKNILLGRPSIKKSSNNSGEIIIKREKIGLSKIRNRIIAVSIIPTMITLGIIIVYFNNYLKEEVNQNFLSLTYAQTEQIDKTLTSVIQGNIENCDYLAGSSLVQQADNTISTYIEKTGDQTQMTPSKNGGIEQDIYELFVEFAETHPENPFVYMGTENGGYIQLPEGKVDDNYDPRVRDWYKNALNNSGKVVMSKPFCASGDDTLIIGINKTVTDNVGDVIGVIGIDVGLSSLTNMIKELKIGETGYLILTDADGTILAHPKNQDMNMKNYRDLQVKGLEDITKVKDDSYDINLDGKDYLANVYTSPQLGWRFISVVEKSELLAESNDLNKVSVLIAIIVLFIVSFILIVFSSRMTKPITHLVEQMQQIGSGDLTSEIPENYLKRKDEIGMLATNYQQMLEGLRSLVRNIQESSENLAAGAQQMSASTQQISSGSQEQSSQVQVIAHAMEDVAGEDEQLSRQARDAAHAAKEASDTANKGVDVINNVVGGMRDINENMQKLNINSQKIGEIISVIDDIANQTNLLALNAAIEAARAGEHGRGFAVVADEVRKLAERSGKATKEISQLIITIQEDMSIAVVAADKGGQMTEDAGKSFAKITQFVAKSAELIEIISEAVAKQAVRQGELLSTTENIAAVTEETAAGIEEIAASAEEMAAMSERLQNLIRDFKIN